MAHPFRLPGEELSEDEMDAIRKNYKLIASHARGHVKVKELYQKRGRNPHRHI